MFFSVDGNENPLFKIKFGKMEDKSEFEKFKEFWKRLHQKMDTYMLMFDTLDMPILDVSYCYQMAKFIKILKQDERKPLKYSVIIIKSSIIRGLLNIIFKLQRPIATVYLVKDHEEAKTTLEKVRTGQEVSCTKILP